MRGLNGTHVLPVLLEQGNQEVDAHLDVLLDLLLLHRQVAHRDAHAQHLLELELDCRFRLVHLGFQRLLVRNQGRELSCNATSTNDSVCMIRTGW